MLRPDDGGDEIPILDSVTTARLLASGPPRPAPPRRRHPGAPVRQGPDIDSPTTSGICGFPRRCVLGTGAALRPDARRDAPDRRVDAYVGAGRTLATVGLAGAYDDGPVLLALNLGFRTGSGSDLGTIEVSPALHGALGAAVRLNDTFCDRRRGRWRVVDRQRRGAGDLPAEALLSVRQAAPNLGAISLGVGTGLTQGIGAPDLRLVLGLTWTGEAPEEEPAPAALNQTRTAPSKPSL